MLLSYPLFVVEELTAIALTLIVTYAIVIRFELPIYYIIPIIAVLSSLGVVIQKQAHGPDTDDTILQFAAAILMLTAGTIHLIILKMRFNWLETIGLVLVSGIFTASINYLIL